MIVLDIIVVNSLYAYLDSYMMKAIIQVGFNEFLQNIPCQQTITQLTHNDSLIKGNRQTKALRDIRDYDHIYDGHVAHFPRALIQRKLVNSRCELMVQKL